VRGLQVAWTFHTGDAYQPTRGRSTAFESTPIYVEGILYLGTPLGRVFALDPVSGAERWSYDSKVPRDKAMAISPTEVSPRGSRLAEDGASTSPPSTRA
jgi:glucose dehydrogenase